MTKKDSKAESGDPKKKTISIRPVEYVIFCDYASMSVDGKMNLNGIFSRIMTEQVPAKHPQMHVMSKFLLPKGEHKLSFTIMQKDKVLAKSQLEKSVEQPLSAHTHMWNIQGLNVETMDPLEMQIFIGGKQVYARKLPVVKVEKK